jgi:hypothetical protein
MKESNLLCVIDQANMVNIGDLLFLKLHGVPA